MFNIARKSKKGGFIYLPRRHWRQVDNL